mmetsp:Transcript_23290/g.75454  ORF Transcript_23290/g.75454 Transcript_23290/m.75454 type:complete len:242 (-) Transcript_23290:264-989(-)
MSNIACRGARGSLGSGEAPKIAVVKYEVASPTTDDLAACNCSTSDRENWRTEVSTGRMASLVASDASRYLSTTSLMYPGTADDCDLVSSFCRPSARVRSLSALAARSSARRLASTRRLRNRATSASRAACTRAELKRGSSESPSGAAATTEPRDALDSPMDDAKEESRVESGGGLLGVAGPALSSSPGIRGVPAPPCLASPRTPERSWLRNLITSASFSSASARARDRTAASSSFARLLSA